MAQKARVEDLAARRQQALRAVATLKEEMRALRGAETYEHPSIAPGYQGKLAQIVTKLKRNEPHHEWMPTPLPAGSADTPPLSASEAAELRELLNSATPQRQSRASQRLPLPTSFPPTSSVRSLIVAEDRATTAAAAAASSLSRRLDVLDVEALSRLEECVERAETERHALGLVGTPNNWDQNDWRIRALTDGMARREQAVWRQVTAVASQAHDVEQSLTMLGLRKICLSELATEGQDSAVAHLKAARTLRDYLKDGGKLKKILKPAAQKQTKSLLNVITVDGIPPTTVDLLDPVVAWLDAEVTATALADKWQLVDLEIEATAPMARRIAQLVDAATALQHIERLVAERDAAEKELVTIRIRLPLNTMTEWLAFAEALAGVRMRLEAQRATTELDDLAVRLSIAADDPEAPPELQAARTAVAGRDLDGYDEALRALAKAHAEYAAQTRCDELWGRLHVAHPGLAQLLERTADDTSWERRFGSLPDAWAWAKAHTFFVAQRRPGLEQELDIQLRDAVAKVQRVTTELAAENAWSHCLNRMTPKQTRALHSYQGHIRKLGKGTGPYADRYRRDARQALGESRGAVAAWVMPLSQVVETIPPDQNSFDVVIVDEASQASLERLFLLWLAPRVIVVGDDKQCTPSQVTHGRLQPIFDRLDERLPEVPEHLRTAFTPGFSLFSILKIHFGSVIQLREHFRCMPEIIGWSSRQFYSASPLVPLRQFGADRLAPLQVRYVSGAMTEGSGTSIRNPVEAEALVNALVACLADPAYAQRTFGVVVLQGSGRAQVGLIEAMLQERISADEQEQRRLRVGTSPEFQGDERHIVFLSMVIAEKRRAWTDTNAQQRFNVAASRAQDQLWLFHSVTADLLSPGDLRRSLLTYMQQPPSPFAQQPFDHINDHELYEPFDSLFEQRVFLRIRERGYHVAPQVEINGRRIDLVVSGAKGRLAVECDGRRWHGTPAQQLADLDREQELKRAGWRFWRLRESEFHFDPDAALTPLWNTLAKLQIRPGDLAGSEDGLVTGDDWSPVSLPENESVGHTSIS